MWAFIICLTIALIILCLRERYKYNARTDFNKNHTFSENIVPYNLKTNEITQGEYKIALDIPSGTYDFFVVYGDGGSFNICKYSDDGKIENGTLQLYNIGLKEEYEKSELIHIECKCGYTLKISGNIVLKIVKSNNIVIDL